MNIEEHTSPEKLERYAFLWSLLRMVLAALALLFGGVPLAYKLIGYSSNLWGLMHSLLGLAWLISGVAALYLLYLWNKNGQTVFGGKERNDLIAFFVMIVSGINLGLVPIVNTNIGMNIFGNSGSTQVNIFFLAGAVIYAIATYHLWNRWKACGESLFGGGSKETSEVEQNTLSEDAKTTSSGEHKIEAQSDSEGNSLHQKE